MTRDEKEILKRIEEKLDKFGECTIRHDEQIKNISKVQKILIGAGISMFVTTLGTLIAAVLR